MSPTASARLPARAPARKDRILLVFWVVFHIFEFSFNGGNRVREAYLVGLIDPCSEGLQAVLNLPRLVDGPCAGALPQAHV